MKVLKEGKVNQPPPPWWTLCIHACRHCGAEWTLDVSDRPEVMTERSPYGDSICVSECPTCQTQTHTSRSRATKVSHVMRADIDAWAAEKGTDPRPHLHHGSGS